MAEEPFVLRVSGKLGPIIQWPEGRLALRPLTIFVGKQGTAKSLVSQIVYFFENLPFLVRYFDARMGPQVTDEKILRQILDSLRSRDRAIGVFADPSVSVCWGEGKDAPCFHMDKRNRQIRPNAALLDLIRQVRTGKRVVPPLGNALFVPAERVVYSHASGPSTWEVLALPSVLTLFGEAMDRVGKQWAEIHRDRRKQNGGDLWQRILGGQARRRGERWKWQVDGRFQIDIDMASSGQKANWPLLALAEALPVWATDRQIGLPFTVHVEEPEIHLHPEAQAAIIEVLAYLVNQGFRLVLTTHSLTVLYKINNLVLASRLGDVRVDNLPPPEVRLLPDQVGAYLFRTDGIVEDIVERESGFISEVPLGALGDHLMAEMNAILASSER